MIVQELIDELSRRLRDVRKKQWDDSFLVSALNASFRALTTVIPESYSVHRNIELVAGTEQSIPSTLHKIVHLMHNVCPASGQAKRAITLKDVSVMDSVYPQWRQDKPREYIRHWFPELLSERSFHVWPPAPAGRGEAPVVPDEPVDPGLGQSILIDKPAWADLITTFNMAVSAGVDNWVSSPNDGGMTTNFISNANRMTDHVTNNEIGSYLYVDKMPNSSFFPGLERVWWLNDSVRIGQQPLPAAAGVDAFSGDPNLYDYQVIYPDGFAPNPVTLMSSRPFVFRIRERSADARTGVLELLLVDALQVPWDALVIDPILIGPTQEETDQYQADLAAYNAAVAALTAWESADVSITVRGLFTSSPYIDNGAAPVVPEVPVDPGSLGFGVPPTDAKIVDFAEGNPFLGGRGFWFMRLPDGDPLLEGGTERYYAGDAAGIELDLVWPGTPVGNTGTSGAALTVELSTWFLNSTETNSAQTTTAVYRDNIQLNWTDLVVGETYRIVYAGGSRWDIIAENPYQPGATQEELDQYQTDLAIYDAAVAALEAYNTADLIRLTSDLPFDNIHLNALMEYALYYAYAVDDDLTANSGRAERHWLHFFQILNKKEDQRVLIGTVTEATE